MNQTQSTHKDAASNLGRFNDQGGASMWWTASVNTHEGEWIVSVKGERFRVRLRPRHGHLFEYDYTWLTGRNDGYGFGESGPTERGEAEHRARIRWFLGEIDPSTGYLAED